MDDKIKKIIDEFSTSNYSKEAQKEFHSWLVDQENSKAKENELYKLWLRTDSSATSETKKAFKKVSKRIVKTNKSLKLLIWQVAAAALLISTVALSFMINNINHSAEVDLIEDYTPIAWVDSVYLPDGTLVYKNSKTTLLFPNEFKGETRSVYLIGEATFKVKKGVKPFIVKTSDLSVTALGTEFNVEAYPDDEYISATLLSGSIAIDSFKESKQTIIQPEEQFTYNKHNHQRTIGKVNTEIINSWIDGSITIQNKTIYEVIKLLERKFDYTIQYNSSIINKEDKYNFKFRRNATFDEVMQVIQTVSGVGYKIIESSCILS